jgi:formylglycine-generating enzyme required for sulfatase activity
VKQNTRPALLAVALGAALTAFCSVAVCTKAAALASDWVENSPLAARVLGSVSSFERAPSSGDSVQLTSAAFPRIAFASVDAVIDELDEADRPVPMNGLCPANMASVDDRFCIDKYEGSLLEILPSGEERPYPFYQPVEGHKVRAVSEKGVYPQGYISGKEAGAACKASGKRLCKPQEWKSACKGPEKLQYGYAKDRKPGTCNDNGRSPLGFYFAHNVADGSAFSSNKMMNDPQLNQLPGTLAETGSHEGCTNGYGVYDMVGNIHEWVDDADGAFQGGYYLDVEKNGDGCGYKTDAHRTWYHDYSTGFRCCADVGQ